MVQSVAALFELTPPIRTGPGPGMMKKSFLWILEGISNADLREQLHTDSVEHFDSLCDFDPT